MDRLSFHGLPTLENQLKGSPILGCGVNPCLKAATFARRECKNVHMLVAPGKHCIPRGFLKIPWGNGFSSKVGLLSLLRHGGALDCPQGSSKVCASAAQVPSWVIDLQPFQDVIVCLFTIGGAMGSLKVFDELAKHDVFDKTLSRKLVHITIGLLFMLFWPLYSDAPSSKYLAALAPSANALRMLALGLGIWEEKAFVKAVTREGDKRELLKGPLYYAVAISAVTILFWRTTPISAVAIANLCAGDGIADIIGRRFGSMKLPYNAVKSYVGSIAMLIFSFLVSIMYLMFFSYFGFYSVQKSMINHVLLVSFASSLVESLPLSTVLDDNLTVPLTAVIIGLLVLR